MRKLIEIFAIAFMFVIAIGTTTCGDATETPVDETIDVTPRSLSFEASGGIQTVTVTSMLDWTATPSAEWIKATKAGDELSIEVSESMAALERTGTVMVNNGKNSAVVRITQAAKDGGSSLTVDPETLDFPATGGSLTVNVTSELEWTVRSHDKWITVDQASSAFIVTVEATIEGGTGSVTVENGVNTKTVTVIQAALDSGLIVDPDFAIWWYGENSTKTLTVTSAREWSAYPADDLELENNDWYRITKVSDTKLEINTDKYNGDMDRIGVAYVSNGIKKVKVDLTQTSPSRELDLILQGNDTFIDMPLEGGEYKVGVVSAREWFVDIFVDWIEIRDKTETGFTVYLQPFTPPAGQMQRTAIIEVHNYNGVTKDTEAIYTRQRQM